MDLKEIYVRMFNGIKSGGVESVLQAAYEVFNMPVAVCDASFEMLAKNYPPTPQDDACWDIPLEEQKVPLEIVQIFQQHNLIDIVNKSPGKSIHLNWGWFKDHPRLTTSILIDNNIIGYLAVLCPMEKYESWHDDALQIVADSMGIVLEKQGILNKGSNIILQSFARDLIMGNIKTQLDFKKWLTLAELNIKESYVILAIAPSSMDREDSFAYFERQLKYKESSLLTYASNGILYVFLYNLSNHGVSESTLKNISELIKSLDLICGMSYTFSDIKNIFLYREQALAALQTGRKIDPQKNIYHYSYYALKAILLSSFDKIQPQNCIHPALYLLKDYDKENNTTYFETLRIYMINQQSASIVCDKLHIHRNTLRYRLKKVEEITNINIQDNSIYSYLLVSFQVLDLIEKLEQN
ncbi:helix-turn-helix domain-containing protein [Irregularibacter muris]|uniref:Helix-turn-helix domain-containing protein n=1 Tax=Irregularibacter muris TaxID=1796619 RepID=A0AAE3L2P5_9FIRM|nr:helix-turn-helix domain-containing protein [Irregularibacter muris]MCR1898964.1 helix-turn-helix domain-containing protein [Irregularibacter muris]